MNKLFTIGYANKSFDQFLSILKKNDITCVVDVRTSPYSHQFPQYNKEVLKDNLKHNGIWYIEFGKYFGARRYEDTAYKRIKNYDDAEFEVVIFDQVYDLQVFQDGYKRIIDGLNKGFSIVFLCSEKFPYDCHRSIMIAEYFYSKGFNIMHLIDENTVLEHTDCDYFIQQKFLNAKKKFYSIHKYKLEELDYGGGFFGYSFSDKRFIDWVDFFKTYDRKKGYYLRNIEIGYKKGDTDDE